MITVAELPSWLRDHWNSTATEELDFLGLQQELGPVVVNPWRFSSLWPRRARATRDNATFVAQPELLGMLLRQGYLLEGHSAQTALHSVGVFVGGLEAALDLPTQTIQASLIAIPPQGRWQVATDSRAIVLRLFQNSSAASTTPSLATVCPGQPNALVWSGPCLLLHLTFKIPTIAHVAVEQWISRAHAELELRRPAYFLNDASRRHEILESWQRSRLHAAASVLPSANTLRSVRPIDLFRLRKGLNCKLVGNDAIQIAVGENTKSIPVPVEMAPIYTALAAGTPLSLAELQRVTPDTTTDELQTYLWQLVRLGLLEGGADAEADSP